MKPPANSYEVSLWISAQCEKIHESLDNAVESDAVRDALCYLATARCPQQNGTVDKQACDQAYANLFKVLAEAFSEDERLAAEDEDNEAHDRLRSVVEWSKDLADPHGMERNEKLSFGGTPLEQAKLCLEYWMSLDEEDIEDDESAMIAELKIAIEAVEV